MKHTGPERGHVGSMSVLILALLFCMAGIKESSGEDWQYWATLTASHKVTEGTTVKLLADAYFRDDMSNDYLYDQYVTIDQSLGGHFHCFVALQHVDVEKNGDWEDAWKIVPGLNYSFGLPMEWNAKLQDRFYYQFDPVSEWDHHRPRVYLTRKFGSVKLTFSDEVRMDLTGEREDALYRNRALVSLSKSLTDSISLGLGYVRQADRKNGEWECFNVVQTTLGCSL